MIQISSRHKFLEGFLGTKPEEDISYANSYAVNMWITGTTCICSILEIVLYFVFNRKVNKLKEFAPFLWCSLFCQKIYNFLQFHFQMHPWLPIINCVNPEDEEIEMMGKGKEKKMEEK